MGNNSTVRPTVRPRGAIAGLGVAALAGLAGCGGTEPDPTAIARSLAPRAAAAPVGPAPVSALVASWNPDAVAPAPLGEARAAGSIARPATPPRARLAIGPQAEGALEPSAGAALAQAADCELAAFERGNDRDALERLIQGQAELAVVATRLSPRDQRGGLQQTRLGVELFAVAVAADRTPRSLTAAQLRKVLTGELRSWNELGHDGGTITVLVPADTARAERAAKALIPGDPFAAHAVAVADAELPARLQQPGALAVVRVADAPRDHVRLLAIDWSVPSHDTFAFGTYPFGLAVSLVTAGEPAGSALAALQFTRSRDGRALLARTLLLPD